MTELRPATLTVDLALRRLIELADDSAPLCPALAELLHELAASLEAQPAVRQNAVLGVLFIAFAAFDEEEESCGNLLLQVAVLLAAVHEETAMGLLIEAVQAAKSGLRLLTN